MTFEDILALVKQGKKARRSGWAGYYIEYSKLQDMILCKHSIYGTKIYEPHHCDLVDSDWELFTESEAK